MPGGQAVIAAQAAAARTKERNALAQKHAPLKDKLASNSEELMSLFAEWDEDGDGNIDFEEFRRAVLMMGIRASREDIKEMFELCDEDGSGSIALAELMAVLDDGPSPEKPNKKKPKRQLTAAQQKVLDGQREVCHDRHGGRNPLMAALAATCAATCTPLLTVALAFGLYKVRCTSISNCVPGIILNELI